MPQRLGRDAAPATRLQLLAAPGRARRLGVGGDDLVPRLEQRAQRRHREVGRSHEDDAHKRCRTFRGTARALSAAPWHRKRSRRWRGALARLPGLGPRSARRAVLWLVKRRETALVPARSTRWPRCRTRWSSARPAATSTPQNPCGICADPRRDAAPAVRGRGRRRPVGARPRAAVHRALPRARRAALGARRRAAGRPDDRHADRARRGRRDRRGRAGDERHARRPDHRALHRRAARRPTRCGSPSSPTACRSAASSTTSTKARWRRRCGRGGRSDRPDTHLPFSARRAYLRAMAIREILEVPDPRLKIVSEPVDDVRRRAARRSSPTCSRRCTTRPASASPRSRSACRMRAAGDRPAARRSRCRARGLRPRRRTTITTSRRQARAAGVREPRNPRSGRRAGDLSRKAACRSPRSTPTSTARRAAACAGRTSTARSTRRRWTG